MSITTHFQDTFPSLSKKKKTLWRILASLSKKYANIFPSHAWLSKQADCSRKTVIRAISEFREYGWLATVQGQKTCHYFLNSEILDDKKCYKVWVSVESKNVPAQRKNVPGALTGKEAKNVPHTKDSSLLIETYSVPRREIPKKRRYPLSPHKRILPHFISQMPIDDNARTYLSKYPDQVLFEAYNDFAFYTKKNPNRCDNINAVIISNAKRHAAKTLIMNTGETMISPNKEPSTPAKLTGRQKFEKATAEAKPFLPKGIYVEFYNKHAEICINNGTHKLPFNYEAESELFISKLSSIYRQREG